MTRTACALLFAAATGWAQAQTPATVPAANDGLQWLQRIYRATETLSYSGTFVYQQGNRTETSRITRRAGTGGTIEKLEIMDGTPREILRTPDEVRCYLPESRTIKVDRRGDTGNFPALLPEQVGALQDNYEISLGATARIAGYDCQAIVLSPKDDLRYGYALWADVRTAMLLRAQTFNGNGDLVEQFSFVMLDVGDVPRSRLRPPRAARDWRVEQAAVSPVDLEQSGWRVEHELPGFRKVAALRRVIGKAHPVNQIVYSDGMAALSIFIEPMSPHTEKARIGLSGMGAVNVYTRQVDQFLVTVVGEAPAKSVQRIGDTVQYRPQ